MGLTTGSRLGNGVEPDLELFKLDADVCVLGIEVTVTMDLAHEPPIVMVNKGVVVKGKIGGGAHHEESEPRRKRVHRRCVCVLIVLVVGRGV